MRWYLIGGGGLAQAELGGEAPSPLDREPRREALLVTNLTSSSSDVLSPSTLFAAILASASRDAAFSCCRLVNAGGGEGASSGADTGARCRFAAGGARSAATAAAGLAAAAGNAEDADEVAAAEGAGTTPAFTSAPQSSLLASSTSRRSVGTALRSG
eukprot:CAMPEP_0177539048 /NCGR_PEP_ID=MMETSP0369-20130122/58744_1 /TAXON_ID=447022 ORGANISM="Scrippsiella hangoei-like, Strain SHHI-4" /NCGR_SAMPLE_ID=MMETSP0369 /ASSEMBLY_ACC=CAM_ASM_000364 /LENGTH=156 /DNA_ID=CAMNT_0019021983 /DNA_START=96 /DNA_END=563 /DNA_ORIENTATION=-